MQKSCLFFLYFTNIVLLDASNIDFLIVNKKTPDSEVTHKGFVHIKKS